MALPDSMNHITQYLYHVTSTKIIREKLWGVGNPIDFFFFFLGGGASSRRDNAQGRLAHVSEEDDVLASFHIHTH